MPTSFHLIRDEKWIVIYFVYFCSLTQFHYPLVFTMVNILTIFLLILRLGNGRLLGYVDKVSYSPTLNFHPRVTAKSNSSDYEDHGNRRCFNKVN